MLILAVIPMGYRFCLSLLTSVVTVSSSTYRLDVAYEGTDFYGWQSQPSGRTVQDVLSEALRVLTRGEVTLVAASRTDTGVHALGQVVLGRFGGRVDREPLLKGLHALLPRSIGVLDIQPVAPDFHPTRDARGKVYRYRIWQGQGTNPFLRPLAWWIQHPLQVEAMDAALRWVVGTHDFTSFCASDSSARTKVRTLLEVAVERRGDLVEMWFAGDGFLKQMIRNLVGTAVEVGRGRLPPESMREILMKCDRQSADRTAPGHGLCLMRVFYGRAPNLREVREATWATTF